ncbi:hypothetical protein FHQ08_08305 [Lactobacillus sp. CC-MHH1034]|uniref:hypothetical protein n=1 Tax=Agrilactobacillus fermenti TaxID=2586909 RepID=UPI001E5675C5|nr:hypothetical protein [Agrilactobacillus fermenti]MCD2256723.1 hypothetical protein [Agrilactobacillus fermenti]
MDATRRTSKQGNNNRTGGTKHRALLWVFTIILMFTFAGFVGTYLAHKTVLNESFTQSVVNQPKNQKALVTELQQQINQSGTQNGLSQEITGHLIDQPSVVQIADKTIHNVYQGQTDPVPTTTIQAIIREKIKTLIPDTLLNVNLDSILSELDGTIKNYLDRNIQPQATALSQRLQTIKKAIQMAMIVTGMIAIVCLVIILLNAASITLGLRYLGYGLTGGTLISGVGTFIARMRLIPTVTNISRQLQGILDSWIDKAVGRVYMLSGIFIVGGLILVLITSLIYHRQASKN